MLPRQPGPPSGKDYQRGRLGNEFALSTHEFTPFNCFMNLGGRLLIAAVLLLVAALLYVATVRMFQQGKLPVFWLVGSVTFALGASAAWLISSAVKLYSQGVEQMEVCHSGLRWRKGGKAHLAPWGEIASLTLAESATVEHGRRTRWSATCTIVLASGEWLVVTSFTLSNFVGFANAAQQHYNEAKVLMKRQADHLAFGSALDRAPRAPRIR